MQIFYALLIILIYLIVAIILITFAFAGISAAPYVPLWKSDIRRMLKLAGLKEGEKLIDLGSGDGRILKIAANEFKAKAVGFEISVLPYFISYIRIKLYNLKSQNKIQIKYQNFFKAN